MNFCVFRGYPTAGSRLNCAAVRPRQSAVDSTAQRHHHRPLAPALRQHLVFVRGAVARAALRTGLAVAFPVLLGWLAFTMPLDWWVELPRWSRALCMVFGVGSAGLVGWRFGVRDWVHRPADEAVALCIERALPEFRGRFIASVQLSREDDGALVHALVDETASMAGNARLANVVDRTRLRFWLKVGAALLLTGAAGWWAAGSASWALFQRALLFEVAVPRRTQILAFTGNRTVALGDDVRIEAKAGGVIPAAGMLRLKSAAGKRQEFSLDATPGGFSRTLQSVQESFDYVIELGDSRSATARVKVRPRPSITRVAATQIWPAYIALPLRPRPMSDLKLLAGSKLVLGLKASSSLRSATLRFLSADQKSLIRETSLKPVAGAALTEWEVTADVPTKDAAGMAFHLVDEEGVESKATTIYRLEVVPDKAPEVRVLWPVRREELVTRGATLLVSFEAKDDYGVAKVRLHYGLNWKADGPHKTVDLDLGGAVSTNVTRRFDWHLDRIGAAEGDVIDYWLEAVDGNTATGPGVGVLAEHYQARVVSEADKRADLAARLDDTLRGLNDVKEGQEELSKRLGEMIQVKGL